MSWETLKAAVEAVITENGNNEITGVILKDLLINNLIPQLGDSLFKGLAIPETSPGTPEKKEMYLAYSNGTYPNFGGIAINKEVCLFVYNFTAWDKMVIINQSIIDQYLTQEIANRQSADTTLQANIDVEKNRIDEILNLSDADKNTFAEIVAYLTQEIADRESADTTLQANIDVEKNRIDEILNLSDADKNTFAEIVALINSVDTENDTAFANYVLANDKKVDFIDFLQKTTANKALSFVVQKFDVNAITDDVRTLHTGATSENTDYFTTDFIPYTKDLDTTFYGFRKDDGAYFSFYDKDKQYFAGSLNPISGKINSTTSETVRWVKFSCLKIFKNTLQILVGNKMFFPNTFLNFNESETRDTNALDFVEEQNSNKNYDIFENFYDKIDFIPNVIVNQTNGITQSYTGKNTSHFIDVKGGYYVKILGTFVNNYAFSRTVSEVPTETAPNNIAQSYDSGAFNSGYNTTVLVPEYASKFRFSFDATDNNNVIVLIGSAKGVIPQTPTQYVPFGTKLKTLKPTLLPPLPSTEVTATALKELMYEQTRNAVIFKGIKYGKVYNAFSGNLSNDSTSCYTTIGRKVEEGDILRLKEMGYAESNTVGIYTNLQGDFVGGHVFNSSNLIDTAPTGAKLFFHSFRRENLLTKIITVNSENYNYIKGEERLKIEFDPNNVRNLFKGLVIDFTGDSITAQERYLREVVNQLEIGWVKNALGGQKLSGTSGMHVTAFDDNDSKRLSANSHIYTLNAGANDWNQNTPIGVSQSNDTTTFLGALNSYVTQFFAEKPNKPLVIIGTTPAFSSSFTNGYVNNNGDTSRDFSDAMQEEVSVLRATYPHLHFVNTYQQFADENKKIDFPDDIHPGEVGGAKMAIPIIKKLVEIVNNLETILIS